MPRTAVDRVKLAAVSAWSRYVNKRNRDIFLVAYAGDLVYDGFCIATDWEPGTPLVMVLRDYGSQVILCGETCRAVAAVNPPSETVQWLVYDPEGTTDGWGGAFLPITPEAASELFQTAPDLQPA